MGTWIALRGVMTSSDGMGPLAAALVLVFAGCGEAAVTTTTTTGEGGHGGVSSAGGSGGGQALPEAKLPEAFEAEGFTTQPGMFSFIDITDCCDSFCFGNNPASPYASVALPPGPGQVAENPATTDDGMSTAWRLRADEAVVLVGQLPPPAAYMSFTAYLYDRADAATPSGRRVVFASLGEADIPRVGQSRSRGHGARGVLPQRSILPHQRDRSAGRALA